MLDGNSERPIPLCCPQNHHSAPIRVSSVGLFYSQSLSQIFIMTRMSDADCALERATLRFVSASQNITHCKETRLWRNQQDEMSQHQLCVRSIVFVRLY